MKNIISGAMIVVAFLGGFWLANWWQARYEPPPISEQSHVILDKIKQVYKLVTVEGNFVEYYDYTEPDAPYFIGPFINFEAFLPRKHAKLKIHAKVLVGYDLNHVQMETRNDEKRIIIKSQVKPNIMAIDHELSQFDNEASIFRPLTNEDYTKIDKRAKEKIAQAAISSGLLEAAEQQAADMMKLITFMAEQAGWQVEYSTLPVLADTLAQ